MNPTVLASGIVRTSVPVAAVPPTLVTDTLTVLEPADSKLGLIDNDTDKSTPDELTEVTATATLLVTFVSVVVVAMLAVALTLPVAGTT